MNRRTFVVLLGTVAGCNSVGSSDPSSETPPPTSTRTRTTTSTPPDNTETPAATTTETETATERPTPTDTETPTPTAAERRGARQIEQAKTQLTDVVGKFTAGYGSELTAVTAASTDFPESPYELQVGFANAQRAYVEARQAAATDEQAQVADRLRGCWHFLSDARDTQREVVTAYRHLASARDAFDQVRPDDGRAAADRVQTSRRHAMSHYRTLTAESTVAEASVIDSISEEEYRNKVAQLEADIDVFRNLNDILDEFAEGINWYRLARLEFEKEDRHVQNAEAKADEARVRLADVSNALTAMLGELGDDTTLVPMLKSLRSIASEKAREAARMDN